MSDTAAPAAPVTKEPTKLPPPPQGNEGAGALVDAPKTVDPIDDSQEFELDIKGQKQKVKANRQQLTAILQKALYADQMIKDATQAKKGAEALYGKLKSGDVNQIKEVLTDPDINVDIRKMALEIVRGMMDDEQLSPEAREARDLKKKVEQYENEKKQREEQEKSRSEQEKQNQLATQLRATIITAMKEYPDMPQNQATMDSCIQYMRANYRKFGKTLPPSDAMKLVARDYWTGVQNILNTMSPEKIVERFGQKTLDKLQALKLKELKDRTNPGSAPVTNGDSKKKKFLTEKEYDKAFAQRIAGL